MKNNFHPIIKILINKFSNYTPKEISNSSCIKSSVLVPIYFYMNKPSILFIKRSNLVKYHKGEVSYPGGTYDNNDNNLLETALRETEEELGINRNSVQIICQLDDEITVSTNFLVRPYLSFINNTQIIPNPLEIEDIIYIPIKNLLCQKAQTEYRLNKINIALYYSYYYKTILIWGATARILHNFTNLIKDYK